MGKAIRDKNSNDDKNSINLVEQLKIIEEELNNKKGIMIGEEFFNNDTLSWQKFKFFLKAITMGLMDDSSTLYCGEVSPSQLVDTLVNKCVGVFPSTVNRSALVAEVRRRILINFLQLYSKEITYIEKKIGYSRFEDASLNHLKDSFEKIIPPSEVVPGIGKLFLIFIILILMFIVTSPLGIFQDIETPIIVLMCVILFSLCFPSIRRDLEIEDKWEEERSLFFYSNRELKYPSSHLISLEEKLSTHREILFNKIDERLQALVASGSKLALN